MRDGQEHRDLCLSQLEQHEDKFIYYENVSNSSFKQLRVKSKIVPLYAAPDLGEKCSFSILAKYISKLPAEALCKAIGEV